MPALVTALMFSDPARVRSKSRGMRLRASAVCIEVQLPMNVEVVVILRAAEQQDEVLPSLR